VAHRRTADASGVSVHVGMGAPSGETIDRVIGLFDAWARTAALQESVRLRDRGALEQMVVDDFLFSSTRVSRQIDRAGWIDWACATEWVSFDLGVIRTIELGLTRVVEFVVDQVIGGESPSSSRWLVTDVWTVKGAGWRLAARHPELWIPPRP